MRLDKVNATPGASSHRCRWRPGWWAGARPRGAISRRSRVLPGVGATLGRRPPTSGTTEQRERVQYAVTIAPTGTFGPDAARSRGASLLAMVWFFRVLALEDGTWQCRWGPQPFDTHESLVDAVEHCSTIAAEHRPAEVLLHRLDGVVQSVATLG
jgi:hypothetical protein